jgi:2-polyprenyl-3-methyl-5-hydroxy-6-metoxy-1,4-benzoquinol methylase
LLRVAAEGLTSRDTLRWSDKTLLFPNRRMTATRDLDQRFQTGAQKYAEYLESPEGRLRTDLAFANLQDFFPSRLDAPVRVLDVGCGTGAIGVRLARLGCQVTLLDSSQPMLDIAKQAAVDSGVSDSVTLHRGDASELADIVPAASFDVVICHNVLEFLPEPEAVLRACARALRGRSAILSVIVRNQAGEVLKAALKTGDLDAAAASLIAEWGYESLYGEKVRLFTGDAMLAMLQSASLETVAERGIRIVADYLPPEASREKEYDRVLELEKNLGCRPDFARVARYLHVLARLREDGA